jgi:plasmid stabilization system protein ParE
VKVSYRQAASDDVVRQFRYYLVTLNVPEVAVRFRDAVRKTVQSLCQHPQVGAHGPSSSPGLRNPRTCPSRDLKPSGFTIVWVKTPSVSFESYTADAMFGASSDVGMALRNEATHEFESIARSTCTSFSRKMPLWTTPILMRCATKVASRE